MAGGCCGKEEGGRGKREPRLVYVLALPPTALPAVVSSLEAAIPRKARSCLPRAAPLAWWSWKVPILPPPPAKNQAEEEVRSPRPQCQHMAPSLNPTTASPAKKPAKRARRCLHCDVAETPQWRSGPLGRSSLCNACGVRYRVSRALREYRPAARPVAEAPPESPIAVSPPESQIWKPEVSPAIYLVRKPVKLRRPPRKEAAPAPPPPRPRGTKGRMRSCLHCGSSQTPQWREGPTGRGTLCNACGVRYRQGRLLPEYRPIASPTFVPSEHANTHRRVLELRRHQHRQNKDPHHPSPPAPVDSHTDLPIGKDHPTDAPGSADDHPTDAPSCADDLIGVPTSLDSLLLDGPSAPLIADGDEFLIN